MSSILRYPGSKRRLLKTLDTYFKPRLHSGSSYHSVFVGGGSDLLHVAREYPDVALYANDLDEGVASLWKVVVGSEDDLEALEGLVTEARPTVELRGEIKRQLPEDLVARAFQAIFVNRTSFSGIWSAGPLGGRDQRKSKITDRWRPVNIVRALREARELLEGRLEVASMDAVAYLFAMAEEDPDCLFYLDPPYIQEGWQLYREIMTSGDHERLAAVLRRVPRWVLSYDLCDEVEALYSWARIEPVTTCYTTAKTQGAKKRARRTEVVVEPADPR
jgi:DNA adenine methylase